MEDFLGFFIVSIFVEFIFWGVAYITGCVLTPIVSLGKWYPDAISRNPDTGKRLKSKIGFKLSIRSGKTYLGAWAVAFIGFIFWLITAITLWCF